MLHAGFLRFVLRTDIRLSSVCQKLARILLAILNRPFELFFVKLGVYCFYVTTFK